MLKAGYLSTVTYGFRRDGSWIVPTLRYTAQDLAGAAANDDDPGRVKPGADVSRASFYSYLTYSAAWDALSSGERRPSSRNCHSPAAVRRSLRRPGILPMIAATRPAAVP